MDVTREHMVINIKEAEREIQRLKRQASFNKSNVITARATLWSLREHKVTKNKDITR